MATYDRRTSATSEKNQAEIERLTKRIDDIKAEEEELGRRINSLQAGRYRLMSKLNELLKANKS